MKGLATVFGPAGRDPVAGLFRGLLGVVFVVAWASLGVQIDVLIGSRGLMPAAELSGALATHPELSFFDVPTLFRSGASDGALHATVWAGLGLGVLIVLGVVPRLALVASTVLYLSVTVVARNFLSFQWDNLLLECGALAALLPVRRRSPWVLFLLEVLLFKLYFESGIAKYQSSLGDWKDGTAMLFYYETAPIPTRLAWYAHHFSPFFHALESRATLAFEILVPFLIFGPRPARLVAFFVFAGFQIANILTANYGFFSYLALVLGVLLLDAGDVKRAQAVLRRLPPAFHVAARRLRRLRLGCRFRRRLRVPRPLSMATCVVTSFIYLVVSLDGALANFAGEGARLALVAPLAEALAPFRVVNTYHLFGSITRERIEPTFETFDGATWTERDLHYKPGDPTRPPPVVAPHQPRVDFLLWFYGLGAERGTPSYVRALLERLCHDPEAVASLFVAPLPRAPAAVRVAFYQYHFTTAEERRRTGAYWTRAAVYAPRTLECR